MFSALDLELCFPASCKSISVRGCVPLVALRKPRVLQVRHPSSEQEVTDVSHSSDALGTCSQHLHHGGAMSMD